MSIKLSKRLRPDQQPDQGGATVLEIFVNKALDPGQLDMVDIVFDRPVELGPNGVALLPDGLTLNPNYAGPTVGQIRPIAQAHGVASPTLTYYFERGTIDSAATVLTIPTRTGWLRSNAGGFIAAFTDVVHYTNL